MKATYPDTRTIRRYWTRTTFHADGEIIDRAAKSAAAAREQAREYSATVKADVDAMDGATVLATYREGREVTALTEAR